MEGSANPNDGLDGAAGEPEPGAATPGDLPGAEENEGPPAAAAEDWPAEGGGGSPSPPLDGFSGPLDHLLTLARARQIDISNISLAALVEQLAAALHQAPAT